MCEYECVFQSAGASSVKIPIDQASHPTRHIYGAQRDDVISNYQTSNSIKELLPEAACVGDLAEKV
jgi:hypothetical protein